MGKDSFTVILSVVDLRAWHESRRPSCSLLRIAAFCTHTLSLSLVQKPENLCVGYGEKRETLYLIE